MMKVYYAVSPKKKTIDTIFRFLLTLRMYNNERINFKKV